MSAMTNLASGWDRRRQPRTVGSQRAKHKPGELSGGQQQRVANARSLVTRREVIFADEPTGALDTRASREILALLREAVDSLGQTVDTMTETSVGRVAERMTHLED